MQNQKAARNIYQRVLLLEKSFYGLPLVVLAALLPGFESALWPSPFQLLLFGSGFIVLRASGMAFNHLIDRVIDAKNPRTAHRPLPSGALASRKVASLAWSALVLFLTVAFIYSRELFYLSLPVALLVFGYAYTKRFWAGCHFVLGAIHFFAPVLAYVAVTGEISTSSFLLGLAAFFSISGSDILYAVQDLDFDRREGLHSLPARLGERGARQVARLCQLLAISAITLFGIALELKAVFYLVPVALFFMIFWVQAWKKNQPLLFNGLMSGLTLLAVLIDFALRQIWAAM